MAETSPNPHNNHSISPTRSSPSPTDLGRDRSGDSLLAMPPGGSRVTLSLANDYKGQAIWLPAVPRPDTQSGSDSPPTAPTPTRPLLYLHGIQSHGQWFLRSAEALARAGFSVLLPDRRGSGLNQHQRGHADHPRQLLEDTHQAVRWLQEHHQHATTPPGTTTTKPPQSPQPSAPPTTGHQSTSPPARPDTLPDKQQPPTPDPTETSDSRIDLLAVSWSGKLALAYAAEHPEHIRSITLVGPGLCPKIDVTLGRKIKIGFSGAVNPHQPYPIPLDEARLFTANPDYLRFIDSDPLKLTHATAAFLITSRRLDAIARTAMNKLSHNTIPVFLFLAGQDAIIDNNATVELLAPILTPPAQADHIYRLYPQAHHTLDFEPLPTIDHYLHDLVATLATA